MQQRCDLLREQVRRIPEIRDELQMWQEKKLADQKKADLLDDTMALLEQAKENLATSFMGPIRSSFAQYLDQLWTQQEGKVLVTADLDVQMERYGIARELGYFSAGQTDMVMLCMRFALVDALFAEEKPWQGGPPIITSMSCKSPNSCNIISESIFSKSKHKPFAPTKFLLKVFMAGALKSTPPTISNPASLKPSLKPPQPQNKSITFIMYLR